ncbi:MAG: AraC family transcriptional regulator [Pseudomonadota bacterium]
MDVRRFQFDTYTQPDDCFHAIVKDIAGTRPKYWHTHDYFELMVVLDGPLRHDLRHTAETLGSGTAVFLRPADVHLVHAPRGRVSRIFNVMIRQEVIEDLGHRHAGACGGRFFWSEAKEPETLVLGAAVRGRLSGGGMLLRDGPATLLRLEAFLTGVLADLTEVGRAFDADLPAWLARACQAAQAPDVFRDGAAGLARVAGRSHEHLCRAMRAHLGTTPSAWVNGVRMDYAGRLLRDGTLSTQDVADAVGIANLGHFYRLFQAHHSMTPKAFRQRAVRAPI